MSKRRNRGYKRGEPYRDATLFIIACEGEKKEKSYFNFFREKSQRIKIETLTSDTTGKSSPNHVLTRGIEYIETYGLNENDRLWFVFDVDNWKFNSIKVISDECDGRRNWNIAISNPCFEVWLYLHIDDISNSTSKTCKEFKNEINSKIPGGYNPKDFADKINIAIRRAEKLDINPNYFFPEPRTTKLYKLGKEILSFI
jgi:hypothetical protein